MRLPDDMPDDVVAAIVEATMALDHVQRELWELMVLEQAPAAQVEERRAALLAALTRAHRVLAVGQEAFAAWNPHRAEVYHDAT